MATSEQARLAGNVCFKSKQWTEAIEHYTRAIELDPTSAKAYNNRSTCYCKIGVDPSLHIHEGDRHFVKAEQDAAQAVRLCPDWGKAWYRRGVAASLRRRVLLAHRYLLRASELEPQNKTIVRAYKQARKGLPKGSKLDEKTGWVVTHPPTEIEHDPQNPRAALSNPMISPSKRHCLKLHLGDLQPQQTGTLGEAILEMHAQWTQGVALARSYFGISCSDATLQAVRARLAPIGGMNSPAGHAVIRHELFHVPGPGGPSMDAYCVLEPLVSALASQIKGACTLGPLWTLGVKPLPAPPIGLDFATILRPRPDLLALIVGPEQQCPATTRAIQWMCQATVIAHMQAGRSGVPLVTPHGILCEGTPACNPGLVENVKASLAQVSPPDAVDLLAQALYEGGKTWEGGMKEAIGLAYRTSILNANLMALLGLEREALQIALWAAQFIFVADEELSPDLRINRKLAAAPNKEYDDNLAREVKDGKFPLPRCAEDFNQLSQLRGAVFTPSLMRASLLQVISFNSNLRIKSGFGFSPGGPFPVQLDLEMSLRVVESVLANRDWAALMLDEPWARIAFEDGHLESALAHLALVFKEMAFSIRREVEGYPKLVAGESMGRDSGGSRNPLFSVLQVGTNRKHYAWLGLNPDPSACNCCCFGVAAAFYALGAQVAPKGSFNRIMYWWGAAAMLAQSGPVPFAKDIVGEDYMGVDKVLGEHTVGTLRRFVANAKKAGAERDLDIFPEKEGAPPLMYECVALGVLEWYESKGDDEALLVPTIDLGDGTPAAGHPVLHAEGGRTLDLGVQKFRTSPLAKVLPKLLDPSIGKSELQVDEEAVAAGVPALSFLSLRTLHKAGLALGVDDPSEAVSRLICPPSE